jgi:hypothetical protein
MDEMNVILLWGVTKNILRDRKLFAVMNSPHGREICLPEQLNLRKGE